MTVPKTNRQAWVVVVLLAIFMLINTADRAALGLAGPKIMAELNLTKTQFGYVGSSFFLLYSLSAVVTGFLSNRIPVRWTLLTLVGIWSIAQFPLAWPVGLETLVASRILLGAGEGPGYPVATHAAYKWFPDHQRAVPTAIIAQGATLGVVLLIPLLTMIIASWSWHAAFAILGMLGVLWGIAWWLFGGEGPIGGELATSATLAHVPYRQLILNRTTLGAWLVGFGSFWGYSLMITWFPTYLADGLKMQGTTLGLLSALPWLVGMVVVIGVGILSQKLMANGVSSLVARGGLGIGCVMSGGLMLVGATFLPDGNLRLALLAAGISLPTVILALIPPMISEYTPASQRSALLGIGQAVVTLAGVVAPAVMGRIIDQASAGHGYERIFLLCGLVTLVTGVAGAALISTPTSLRDHPTQSLP